MMNSDTASRIYAKSENDAPVRQGEIIRGLDQLVYSKLPVNAQSEHDISVKNHPYAIVVSQDCDLDWDYTERFGGGAAPREHRLMSDVLFCVVSEAKFVRHNPDKSFMNSSKWDQVKTNREERFHFLQKVPAVNDALAEGLPELVVDFKRYFSMPVEAVYEQIRSGSAERRCRLESPYLEHCSHRFAHYQSRVALPHQHLSEQA